MDEIRLTEAGQQAAREMFGEAGPDHMQVSLAACGSNKSTGAGRRSRAAGCSTGCTPATYCRHRFVNCAPSPCSTALGHHDELRAHIGIALRSNPPEMVRERFCRWRSTPACHPCTRAFV